MEPKTVYRIEHEDGWGIFRYGDKDRYTVGDSEETQELLDRHQDGFPTGYGDFQYIEKTIDSGAYFYSFSSLDILKENVTKEEIKFLLTKGFKVLRLVVTDYHIGHSKLQVIYKKESIINQTDISHLFK